jgi:putative membrane protein
MEFFTNHYLAFKACHIISIICWMSGLLYLPRLFVYHASVDPMSEMSQIFKTMERRLLKYIMTPALIFSFGFGFFLILSMDGVYKEGWLHLKVLIVLMLCGFHGFLVRCYKDFERGKNAHTPNFFKIINEIPTFLMIVIVVLVVIKPF